MQRHEIKNGEYYYSSSEINKWVQENFDDLTEQMLVNQFSQLREELTTLIHNKEIQVPLMEQTHHNKFFSKHKEEFIKEIAETKDYFNKVMENFNKIPFWRRLLMPRPFTTFSGRQHHIYTIK